MESCSGATGQSGRFIEGLLLRRLQVAEIGIGKAYSGADFIF